MQIKLRYSTQSNITKTSTLIRGLFFNAIERDIKRAVEAVGFTGNFLVHFVECEMLPIGDNYSVTVVPSHSDRLTGHKIGIIKDSVETILNTEFMRAYMSIEKFEILLDVYGVANPQKIFDASSMDAMEV